jgi:hypothetical protein
MAGGETLQIIFRPEDKLPFACFFFGVHLTVA